MHRAVCLENVRIDSAGVAELRNDVPLPLTCTSPEQTGRMNRGIDYRSDYYSLGVALYRLFVCRLPFAEGEAMELVHSHIARQAMHPAQANPQLPQALGDIVMKLLAKNAEDRYQSLEGLRADLLACRDGLQRDGAIAPFALAQHDVHDRLQIPQKLYGREDEIEHLMAAFRRVVENGAELLLVTGYAGIGKSSLVNEIHKPIVARRGYFIAGKFDKFKRNIPYYALSHAFRQLVRQILTESESRISQWKMKLLDALGGNGQLMIDAIPDLVHIIGRQPEVPQLGPTEAQNRFNYVVRNF
ncbi:MAG: AAA family ATPase, partial [Proteobacteria bacterium]|nr:AAA family ATPase [Pseudomonadota bacterium]